MSMRPCALRARTSRLKESLWAANTNPPGPSVLARPTPSVEEAQLELVRRAAVSHGVATVRCLGDYYRMGNAETNGTEVVAERMIRWFFIQGHDGRAAAIAVILFIAVVPVMLWNVRKLREQEAMR